MKAQREQQQAVQGSILRQLSVLQQQNVSVDILVVPQTNSSTSSTPATWRPLNPPGECTFILCTVVHVCPVVLCFQFHNILCF